MKPSGATAGFYRRGGVKTFLALVLKLARLIMAMYGPILLIEGDVEDHEITRQMIREIVVMNEVITFLKLRQCVSDLNVHVLIQRFIILSGCYFAEDQRC